MYPIVGREYVLSVLTGYLDAASQGSGACVLLEGPIGMGKSRLLKTVAAEGAERGLAVTYIRADANEEASIIRELIIFLRHVISGEVEFHDREFQNLVPPESNPFLLADSLGELIEDAARRRPLLIILDDAQQVDEVSSVALQGLIRSLASAPVLALLARRPVPAQSLAQHAIGWLCEHASIHLSLGPLDDESVAELCAGVLGAKPDASVLGWAARCGGNPWLVKTLMGSLREAGRLVIVDGTASVLAERLPDSVLSAIRRLLDAVPPGIRDLLLLGGRVGPRFTIEDAAALSGESSSELAASVDEAVEVGLVRGNGDELSFVHEVVGEAMQHAAASEADRVDDIEILPPLAEPPVVTCGCEDVAARVVSAMGDLLEAPSRLARALCLLAGAGRGEEASRLADVAVRSGLDTGAEARLMLELVPGLDNAGCHTMSVEHVRRTLARRDLREPDRIRLEGLLAEDANSMGTTTVIEAARSRHEPEWQHCPNCGCPPWAWMIRALIAADQFEEASAVAAAIKQAARTQDEPWCELQWHAHRAELLVTLGRLGEARLVAEAGLRLSARSAPEESVPARAVLAQISLYYGDTATASEHLRTAERLVSGAAVDKTRLDWALTQFHAACGRPGMAVQTLLNVQANLSPDMLLFIEAPTAAATLVRLAMQAGLSAEAECAANLARRVTELNPDVASLAGGAEHAEGLLHHDPDALRRAAEYYQLSGRPLATGTALEDRAQEEHENRHQPQEVEFLGTALDLYLQCDARRDASRVQKKLRRLGVHRAGGHGVDRPTSGWESLTNAELRVVRTIVEGKTNKEAASTLFLSPHTVDSHLRRIFGKLGINTRVELTKHFLTHENA